MLHLLNSSLKPQEELLTLLSVTSEYFVSITSVLFIILYYNSFFYVSHNRTFCFLKAENVLILKKKLSSTVPSTLKALNLSLRHHYRYLCSREVLAVIKMTAQR